MSKESKAKAKRRTDAAKKDAAKAAAKAREEEFVHAGSDRSLAARAIKHFHIKADDAGFDKLQEVLDKFKMPADFPWRNKKRFLRRVKKMEERAAAKKAKAKAA